jgi:multidrug efflux pump subunit AcrA (membrane-fusion protein)
MTAAGTAQTEQLPEALMFGKIHWLFWILAGAAALAAACSEKIEPGQASAPDRPVIDAEVATVRLSTQPFYYEAVGTVTARTASTISGKLLGTVKDVRVDEGDSVEEGDVLVVIDQRYVSAQLSEAKAALDEARRAELSARSAREAAKAGAELARATYERYRQLMKDDSVSQQEFDEIKAGFQQAESTLEQTTAMLEAAGHRVERAKAAAAAARISETDATVTAPYAGRITRKMVAVGDLASPGTPFFTVEKAGQYCADLVLPEHHIHSVALDQVVTVSIPALNERSVQGRIGRIVPSADPKSRSFLIKVALPPDPQVRSGMFVRVHIPVGDTGKLLIPLSAVISRGQLTGVYRVDSDHIARFRLIRLGKRYGDMTEVVSGLNDADRYVVSPPGTMVDGARVKVAS